MTDYREFEVFSNIIFHISIFLTKKNRDTRSVVLQMCHCIYGYNFYKPILLQSVTGCYYKVPQVLQSVTDYNRKVHQVLQSMGLLQSLSAITKFDSCYKVRRNIF